jgi:hypothetical protein
MPRTDLQLIQLTLALSLSALATFAAPLDSTSGPSRDPADLTIWPNQTSRANSDPWLVENHDRIRQMRPRVLLLNFSQEASREKLEQLTRDLLAALKESSRYHGYRDSNAPAFLEYQVFKFVDLRDPNKAKGNCGKVPVKSHITDPRAINMDYNAFFTETFAPNYAVKDPRNPDRFLRLDELVDLGYVHEVWFFGEATPEVRALECVEEKPQYDDQFRRHPTKWVQAGNGGDDDQKWTGRSVRLGFINASRGIGCFLESLSHSIEGTANSRAIPYFTKYFHEFAGHDLKARYDFPHDSFYPLWGEGNEIKYPNATTAVASWQGKTYTLTNYLAYGGNVHFPPNGRRHYDLENKDPVMSTIEDWRIGSGPNHQDRAIPWTNQRFAPYRDAAPDCMGPWLIYWRQNFPGLNNQQKNDSGQPMKNWWPFLFY